MKRIALAFHLNQLTGPYIRTAASASYRALLETLREHPTVPVHLHVSGTLLAGLPWYAPDVLDLIRQGVAAEQFELMGSTYAQNIPESTPHAANELQLAAHREQLDRMFGARPVGFWNPERCYSERYLGLLARGGYRYMLLETAILKAAGLPERAATRVMVPEGSALHLVPDDPAFRAAVNLAIWSGDRRAVEERLAALPAGALVVHAEDAEAVGLWAFERGYSPATDRENLSRLIGWLAHDDGLELVHLSRLLRTRPVPATEQVDAARTAARDAASLSDDLVRMPPVRGQADRMVRALADRELPFHEDGFRDWFDFNARAPRLEHFRTHFDLVTRGFLAAIQALRPPLPPGAKRLVERARETLAACQYEFGCVGIGEMGWPAWELGRSALLLIHAAVRAVKADVEVPSSGSEVADRDLDGVPEIYLQVGSDLLILTRVGGRVLHWIDLHSGEVLGGTALGLDTPGPFTSVGHPFAGPVPVPPNWIPGAPAVRLAVPAPRAWFGRLLAAHVPDLARYKATLEASPEAPPRPVPLTLRRAGLFADEIAGELCTDTLICTPGRSEVAFATPSGAKVIRVTRGLVTCEYPAGYGGGGSVSVRCELLPDRRQRTLPSGPPLRLDATDSAVSVELNAWPEPSCGLWEEIPLAWIAGVTYLPQGSGPLPAFRVELSRHP